MSTLNEAFGLEDKPKEQEVVEKKISIFDILNDLYNAKQYEFVGQVEKVYNAYMINRAMSMGKDVIFYANEMNRYSNLSKRMHFEFLKNSIRSRRRSYKWVKEEKDEYVEIVQFFMKCSKKRAKETISLLSDEQLTELKTKFENFNLNKK